MLGDHRRRSATSAHPRAHDPVHQHERLIGEPDPGRIGISLGKCGAEHPGYLAAGEFQADLPVKRAFFP